MLLQEKPVEYLPDVVPTPEVTRQPLVIEDFDTRGITGEAVQRMADASFGDARVFGARLNLHEFEERERDHQLSPDEDPVKLYDQLMGDINQRVFDLYRAGEITLNSDQLRDVVGHKLGAAAIRGSGQAGADIARRQHDLAA